MFIYVWCQKPDLQREADVRMAYTREGGDGKRQPRNVGASQIQFVLIFYILPNTPNDHFGMGNTSPPRSSTSVGKAQTGMEKKKKVSHNLVFVV